MKPRLSIVVPALASNESLENGLISVLAHRPAKSEVLVVLNRPYDDPYELHDEVRFIQAGARAGLIDCLNVGLASSRGEFVHVLGCGYEVQEGWADAACDHFDDPGVGAVIPWLVSPGDAEQLATAGIEYHPSGRITLHRASSKQGEDRLIPPRLVGPLGVAAFYRSAALVAAKPKLAKAYGVLGADVDLALRLRQAGYAFAIEPLATISGDPLAFVPASAGFRYARDAQRLFWRHRRVHGAVLPLISHAGLMLAELMRALPRPRSFTQVVGRAWGTVAHLMSRDTHRRTLSPPAREAASPSRIDPARSEQPRSRTRAKSEPTARE